MPASVLSLNMGGPQPNPAKKVRATGIGKSPVASALLRAPGPKRGGLGSGLVGDFIGDSRHHGGDYQAVYAYAREELDAWSTRLGRELASGLFGENLTTTGLDVDGALLGERWAVGDQVVLQVCGPRIPCATFQARMGERHWVKRFTEVGSSGAYLAIVTGGQVRQGDPIEVVSRPDHDVDVRLSFRAFSGDLEAAQRVLDAGALDGQDAAELRERVDRRKSTSPAS
ncbi:MOSC domain-containing protein [Pedococcus sp. 5OH_020]|uniref:MOSC domain-containing protein n=1 Tax=Pedococcus sp. 5OH_020 TaxID=2989814 RepID=UPI0022E99EF2|nr:MOSC domain-containing protein [Pedococcus sp. 5OH_020]